MVCLICTKILLLFNILFLKVIIDVGNCYNALQINVHIQWAVIIMNESPALLILLLNMVVIRNLAYL